MELLIGAAVSLLIQVLKKWSKNEYITLATLLAVSLTAAGIYTALTAAGYWSVVATVLTTAGAFYAFVLQRFEK